MLNSINNKSVFKFNSILLIFTLIIKVSYCDFDQKTNKTIKASGNFQLKKFENVNHHRTVETAEKLFISLIEMDRYFTVNPKTQKKYKNTKKFVLGLVTELQRNLNVTVRNKQVTAESFFKDTGKIVIGELIAQITEFGYNLISGLGPAVTETQTDFFNDDGPFNLNPFLQALLTEVRRSFKSTASEFIANLFSREGEYLFDLTFHEIIKTLERLERTILIEDVINIFDRIHYEFREVVILFEYY
jgi:hypothetical protein